MTIPSIKKSGRQGGWIWDIKKYAIHDGPGIRTTVFFKGCPLACRWCCNPESQSFEPELVRLSARCLGCGICLEVCPQKALMGSEEGGIIIDRARCDACGLCARECPGEAMNIMGRWASVDEVLRETAKDEAFYARSGGGLTLSGGEPLAQPEFAAELLRRYKREEKGLSAAVETSGFCDWARMARLLPLVDWFLYDLKHMDPAEHFRLTGVSNRPIIENIKKIAAQGNGLIVRLPLIPGQNDSAENIGRTAEFAAGLPGVCRLDLLPYHRLGEPKYSRLGRCYELGGLSPPEAQKIEAARETIESFGLEVRIGG